MATNANELITIAKISMKNLDQNENLNFKIQNSNYKGGSQLRQYSIGGGQKKLKKFIFISNK